MAAMSSDSTRWTVIRRAAEGVPQARSEFASRYGPVIRAYLGARWRGTTFFHDVDDAAQQVFLDCFKENGALGRVDPERGTGFRPFLYGVVRNVARWERIPPWSTSSTPSPARSSHKCARS